mmetsp:Transcript_28876/g.48477  ORF Transcript_28876/g.48477 Transcript_28876/m.48477 type:complete len:120 (+) Transcript_28876:48-407(+)
MSSHASDHDASSQNGGSSAGDSTHPPKSSLTKEILAKDKVCGFWHIFFFTITFVMGDLVVTWNHGLKSGFWEYLIANTMIGLAYVGLVLCQAEMTSMLPFSGGTYGFARVTLGPFVGYL